MSDEELVKALRDFADDGYADLSVAAADRIEELTAERDDWKEKHDAEALGLHVQMQRAEAAEAKLAHFTTALAMWLLTEAAVQLEDGKIKTRRNRALMIRNLLDEMGADNARATLAEIEGEKG